MTNPVEDQRSNSSESSNHLDTSPPESAALFASTILPLVENEFLTAMDLAKLALVCKVVNASAREDEVWAALCSREYPGTHKIALVWKQQHGHYWLYKRWTAPIVKRRRADSNLPPMDPPMYEAHELQFYIHISYDGGPVYVKNLSGRDVDTLLNEGFITIDLWKSPVVLGRAVWRYPEDFPRYDHDEYIPVFCESFDDDKLDIRIHVRRGNEKDLCCLFRSKDREAQTSFPAVFPLAHEGYRITLNTRFDLSQIQETGYVEFEQVSDERLHLRPSPQASAILHRFPYPVHFDAEPQLAVVKRNALAVTDLHIEVFQGRSFKGRDVRFDSRTKLASHGVSLLHFLSELEAS